MRAKKLAAGRSGDPPGVRPRLPQDGPPGRRRARARPGPPACARASPPISTPWPSRRSASVNTRPPRPCSSRSSLKRPDDAQLQYALGSVLYMQGHLAEAAARLRESLRLEPEQVASRYYLALVARDQGRDAEAIERLEELLRRYPGPRPVVRSPGRIAHERPALRRGGAAPPEGRSSSTRSR